MTKGIATNVESIEELQKEWPDLLENSHLNNLFLTWDWINSWCVNMLSGSETPLIITAREETRLVGIAPLILVKCNPLLTYIQFIGQAYSYHLGFISEKGYEQRVISAFWDHLLQNLVKQYNIIEFTHMEEDPILESVLSSQAAQRKLKIRRSVRNTCKVIELGTDYEDFLKTGFKSINLRNNLKKDIRQLTKNFQVDYFTADENNFERYFRELVFLHREMMKNNGKHSILLGDPFPRHLKHISGIFLKKTNLRLCILSINNETAVILLGIIYCNVFNALTIGINHQMVSNLHWLNLCVLSHALGIKTAIEGHCAEFDFLGGHHEFKYKMGGEDRAGIKLKVYRTGKDELKEKYQMKLSSLLNKIL